MDTENNTPENTGEESQEKEEMKLETRKVPTPPAPLPLIRTLHRDVDTAKGKGGLDDFTPTRPLTAPEEPKEKTVEEEGVPQQVSGFVPPTQLHRVQRTHERPERKTPEVEPKEAPKPPQSALKKKPRTSIVRTYEDDSARALREQKGSIASIAAAERKRQDSHGLQSQEEVRSWKYYIVRGLTTILIIGGIGVLSYAIWQTQEIGTVDGVPEQSIIFAEQVQHQDVTNLSPLELRTVIDSFMKEEIPLDAIRELRLLITTEVGEETVQTPITPEEFLEGVGLERRAPLARALGKRIMISGAGTPEIEAILIADVVSYDSAFASLIRWEQSIADDLDFFIPPATPASSSTTTPFSNQGGFVDVIIENRDARVLYDEFGKIRLLYSFPNTNTLVITTDDKVFRDVLERLGRRTFTR